MLKNSDGSSNLAIDPGAPQSITAGMTAQAVTGPSSTIDGGSLKLNGVDGCRSYRLITNPNLAIDGNGTRPNSPVP